MNDPIGDFLIRIKNAALSGHKTLFVPHSKIKENISVILQKEGFLKKMEVVSEKGKKGIILTLMEDKGKACLIEVKRISKPGRRVYANINELKALKKGLGTIIISSPAGLITDKEAFKRRLGGEVICKIII